MNYLFGGEKQVLSALQKGGRAEDQAIRWLLKKHGGQVQHFVVTHGGSEAEADDVLQEALTELILNVRRGAFAGNSALGTYLFAIGKGIWYKRCRSAGVHQTFLQVASQEGDSWYDPQLNFPEPGLKNRLEAVLQELGDTCREVLQLWSWRFPMEEIAERVNFKTAQVAMNKKNKCLKRLQENLVGRPDLRDELRSFLT